MTPPRRTCRRCGLGRTCRRCGPPRLREATSLSLYHTPQERYHTPQERAAHHRPWGPPPTTLAIQPQRPACSRPYTGPCLAAASTQARRSSVAVRQAGRQDQARPAALPRRRQLQPLQRPQARPGECRAGLRALRGRASVRPRCASWRRQSGGTRGTLARAPARTRSPAKTTSPPPVRRRCEARAPASPAGRAGAVRAALAPRHHHGG